jgi:hypothetical protein
VTSITLNVTDGLTACLRGFAEKYMSSLHNKVFKTRAFDYATRSSKPRVGISANKI